MFLSALLLLFQVTPPQGGQAFVPTTPEIASVRLGQLATGRSLAVQNCQSCHSIEARGISPNPSAPRFRYLSRKYPIDTLQESFAEGVFIGHSVMPQFEFSPDNVAALLAYIKSVQAPTARPVTRKKKK
jgi:mono/diheme cytochrome c family protein